MGSSSGMSSISRSGNTRLMLLVNVSHSFNDPVLSRHSSEPWKSSHMKSRRAVDIREAASHGPHPAANGRTSTP